MIAWMYGSGFPKSMDVSKAIDKAVGAEREVIGISPNDRPKSQVKEGKGFDRNLDKGQDHITLQITTPATLEAQRWEGWGTALKPAMEPITVARKPFKGTVAANVLEHGTGAINIDGCRVAHNEPIKIMKTQVGAGKFYGQGGRHESTTDLKQSGRFPANLIHDGSDDVLELFPDDGEKSAARFFYCPKASKSDRNEGNHHPTVKPTDLMRYLCRLVTPPGGIVLDPFMGSGSTGKAAIIEGFRFIGIEMDEDYMKIAQARIQHELEKSK